MTTLFNAGDLQRLEVERNLTRNTPAVLPEQPGEPVEETPEQLEPVQADSLDLLRRTIFAGMLEILKEKYT
jgi:hypothetical protein